MQTKVVIEYIIKWLKDYRMKHPSIKGFVVGISGGVDSAVVSTLCALSGTPVLALELSIHQEEDEFQRAKKHMKWLNQQFGDIVKCTKIDLSDAFEALKATLLKKDISNHHQLALSNTKYRLRMTAMYYYAKEHEYIVVGSGNKLEDFGLGYYTKYGDGGVDISPIADLFKSEVIAIAEELKILHEIVDAQPTAALFDERDGEEEDLGATYDDFEWVMKTKEGGQPFDPNWSPEKLKAWKIYERLNEANQHKLQAIPRCMIPPKLKN